MVGHTCNFNWVEARRFIQPLITAIGIGISIMMALLSPRHQKLQDRLIYANAAGSILTEVLERICDRLEIRFDLSTYSRTGRKMRQHRANGALVTLLGSGFID